MATTTTADLARPADPIRAAIHMAIDRALDAAPDWAEIVSITVRPTTAPSDHRKQMFCQIKFAYRAAAWADITD